MEKLAIFQIMKIIIVGAGISGLSLAYFLQQKGFDVTVFERDDRFYSARQGFSLTMQSQTKEIFEKYGLIDEVQQLGHRSKRQIFFRSDGEVLYENNDNDKDRFNYPLPRQEIRRIFYDRLKDDTVKFGIKIVDLKSTPDKVIVRTDRGIEVFADYLIACDGINSTIRRILLPEVKLNDLSLCNVYGITDLPLLTAESRQIFDNSEIQILDGVHRFFSKPYDSGKQMWELTWPIKDTIFAELYARYNNGESIQDESLDACKRIVSTWPISWVNEFITVSRSSDIIVHPLFDIDPTTVNYDMLPSNVILIGDTIHAMSPYIGMGANESIYDSYNLAELFERSKDLQSDLREFYKQMSKRTVRSVIRSRDNTTFYHTQDAIDKRRLYEFKKW
jgi:2-polyprenyl-6-methoxyphenol hydroxylase-like FAD-dependent oxidoreductase